MTRRIITANALTAELYRDNYCHVPESTELYNRINASLYRYEPDCPASRQPDV